jgi:uncharacterized membrane protein
MREAYQTGALTRTDRQAMLSALVADLRAVPFDPQAVAERLAQRHAEMEARTAMVRRLLLERLGQMTDAERAAFADRLAQGGPGR